MQVEYIVKTVQGERGLYSSVQTDFGSEPAVNFISAVGDDIDVRDKLTLMGVKDASFKTFVDVEISDAEQREEAIRTVVTAQHELTAMALNKIDRLVMNKHSSVTLIPATKGRRSRACLWLSLVA